MKKTMKKLPEKQTNENCREQQNHKSNNKNSKYVNSAKDVVFTALFSALTAIGAFIKFPLGEMHVTLQFLFTALAGVILGAKRAAISQAVYVFIGLIGVPIFTTGGGFGYVLQPSFGFLLGLIPSAFVIGKLTEKSKSLPRIIVACIAGLGILYVIGLPYMYTILTLYIKKEVTIWTAIYTGMLVYLPGDFLKILITALLSKPLLKAISRN